MLVSSKISNGINGIADIPGDKSISHRSIIIPSIAKGVTEIKNILKSEDVKKTMNALILLGVKIEEQNNIVLALKKDNADLTQQNYDLMKKYQVKTSDPVVNDVIDRIFLRHRQGMEKFKRTMAQNSKTIPEWIEETIEENIDAISYMSTLKDRIVEREEKLLKELDIKNDELTILQLQLDKARKEESELRSKLKEITKKIDGKEKK